MNGNVKIFKNMKNAISASFVFIFVYELVCR